MKTETQNYGMVIRNLMMEKLTILRMKEVTPEEIKEILMNGDLSDNFSKQSYEELLDMYIEHFGFKSYLDLLQSINKEPKVTNSYSQDVKSSSRAYRKKLFKCILTIYSKQDPSVCDFRKGHYYETLWYDDRIELSAHDGEIYVYRDQTWLNYFLPTDYSLNTFFDAAEQALAINKDPYKEMNPFEFAGYWIRQHGSRSLEAFYENTHSFCSKEDRDAVENFLEVLIHETKTRGL